MRHDTTDLVSQAVRAAPAAAGAVASAITMSEWVAIATLTYIIVQVGYLAWKWRWEHIEKTETRDRERRKEAREEQCLPANCPIKKKDTEK